MTRKRGSDAPWRRACEQARGLYCRSCGESGDLQCNHVWPKGQGGPSVVENGMFLCGPFGTTSEHQGGCHAAVTEMKLRMSRDWLDPDQIAWLEAVGYVWWDEDGEVWGRGSRRFEPVRVKKEEEVAWPRI